jgi:D-xylose transport system substrate-binding protein
VSFDGYQVGREQASWLVAHTAQGDSLLVIAGATTDDNARLFDRGAMSVLWPLFSTGARTLAGHVFTPGWDPATAQQETEQALTRNDDRIDGVLAANDGMAGGVIAALKARGLAGRVPVTGQDATVAGLQRILLGSQGETVYKDVRLEARAAASAAVALRHDQPLPAAFQPSSGVPSALLRVVSIDRSNLWSMVRAGAAEPRKLCDGLPSTTGGC